MLAYVQLNVLKLYCCEFLAAFLNQPCAWFLGIAFVQMYVCLCVCVSVSVCVCAYVCVCIYFILRVYNRRIVIL